MSDFRRVNIYHVRFEYYAGMKRLAEIKIAHEGPVCVIKWLAAQRDYPGCKILSVTLEQDNIIVPDMGQSAPGVG